MTPSKVISAVMCMLSKQYPRFAPKSVLEPGDGDHIDEVYLQFPTIEKSVVVNLEQDSDSIHEHHTAKYSDWCYPEPFDMIVARPSPFSAEKFIRQSRDWLAPGGAGLFLCKYSLTSTKTDLWKDVNLRDVWIIAPCLNADEDTKLAHNCEYAYFIFDSGIPGNRPRTDWLNWR